MSTSQQQASEKLEKRYPLRLIPGFYASKPGIQIATQTRADATDEELQFIQQLGVEWVMMGIGDLADCNAENYARVRERFESFGLKIFGLGNPNVHNMEEVTLNLPGRDAKIEEYLRYLRNLSKAGVYYTTYAHMGNGIWSTGRGTMRGGVEARAFDLSQAQTGHWMRKEWHAPLSHGRVYTEDEIWENYTYFIRQVVPVAEEVGVRIGIHPDDPPVYSLGGVPRCIFGNFAGYRRALEIVNSPNVGMCLCVGCWLEGGAGMGKDVVETIRYFGGLKKLFKVHFRNVTRPMPEPWVETFMDDGYFDMHYVMRALREVEFDGAIISDHLPRMIGGRPAAEAWSVGYMRALVQAVNNEFGGPA
jgi:mannonate dehydratase